MSTNEKTDPPSYLEQGSGVRVYNLHTPFTPHVPSEPPQPTPPAIERKFVSTQQTESYLPEESGKRSYSVGLNRTSGTTNCPNCHKQVQTEVSFKAGTYAWLMCLLFICCGLVLCCCLIPFFLNSFKDAHHHCPECHHLLHIEKKKCCE